MKIKHSIAGIIFLFLISFSVNAHAWGVFPAITGGGGGTYPWNTWNEASESTLDTTNAFVFFEENTTTGGNETAKDGSNLSGVSLTVTQYNNVPGASGGYRAFTGSGSGQEMRPAGGVPEQFLRSGKWSIIMKLSDVSYHVTNNTYFFNFQNNGGTHQEISVGLTTAGKLHLLVNESGTGVDPDDTSSSIPATGVVYVAAWADGTNGVRAGFTTTRPTKWSDFGATNRVESSYKGIFTGDVFNDEESIMSYSGQTAQCMGGSLAYFVMASECWIDNTK